jgi:hypothetical protein
MTRTAGLALRRRVGKEAGASVTVHLLERLT